MGQLEKLSGATVLALQSMVHCRPNIEFGLHVHDARETNVDAEEGKMLVQKDLGPESQR
jgi:hypothetical protein